jgi:hypothetical protein
VLSDHEQRALEEIERSYAAAARDPHRGRRATRRSARRSDRPPGLRVVLVLASVSVALFFVGVPAAALAVALATAIGWLFWRLWSHRTDDGTIPGPPVLGDPGQQGSGRRPGESIRRYLRWLAEAE